MKFFFSFQFDSFDFHFFLKKGTIGFFPSKKFAYYDEEEVTVSNNNTIKKKTGEIDQDYELDGQEEIELDEEEENSRKRKPVSEIFYG